MATLLLLISNESAELKYGVTDVVLGLTSILNPLERNP